MLAQLSRYLGVQVVAYGIDMGVFLLLTALLSTGPLWANVAAKIAAGAFAFVAHRRVTFRTHGQTGSMTELLKYSLLLAANVPASSGLLWLLLPVLQPPALAKLVADVGCVALTFLLSRYVVFRRADKPHAAP
jgi:putative flippase GtrA